MNNKITFSQKITSDNNLSIKIDLVEKISDINTNIFLKEYKISNFFYGKFFVKRLIKKIFKYHLDNKIIWDNDFWDKIKISKFKTNIDLLNDNKDSIKKYFKKNINSKRLQDIKKYQNYINDKIDIGCPLYITSTCINILGGDLKNNEVFILDGSRRLLANIMNGLNPDILLIDLSIYNE